MRGSRRPRVRDRGQHREPKARWTRHAPFTLFAYQDQQKTPMVTSNNLTRQQREIGETPSQQTMISVVKIRTYRHRHDLIIVLYLHQLRTMNWSPAFELLREAKERAQREGR